MKSVTIDHIHSIIKKEWYIVVPDTTLTLCVLTLENGFTVTGESACVDPKNFNQELGEKYAKDDAIKKIWALEGYLLKSNLQIKHIEAESLGCIDGECPI